MACSWFGEVPSGCSLTLLLGPAWVLLRYVLQTIFSGPVRTQGEKTEQKMGEVAPCHVAASLQFEEECRLSKKFQKLMHACTRCQGHHDGGTIITFDACRASLEIATCPINQDRGRSISHSPAHDPFSVQDIRIPVM